MRTNEEILKERTVAFNAVTGPRVGDYLKLPYGIYTRFTHEWDESLQTGGGQCSFYLGDGYLSYSGSLDSGVKKTDIRQTDEVKSGWVWFFDKGISGAGRGKDFQIDLRVFEPIEGADLSGCPQIKAYEKAEFLKTVDTVTRINGNGQPYTLPLPEVVILADTLNEAALQRIEENTGLKFNKCVWNGYAAQPVKHSQLSTLLLTYNFNTRYYNNSHYGNQLHLTFNH